MGMAVRTMGNYTSRLLKPDEINAQIYIVVITSKWDNIRMLGNIVKKTKCDLVITEELLEVHYDPDNRHLPNMIYVDDFVHVFFDCEENIWKVLRVGL